MEPTRSTIDVAPALRAATAAVVCLVVVEFLHFRHANLAVWTTHMVMVQHTFTIFQKGIERILGRALGIVLALVLAMLTRNAWTLGFVLAALAMIPLFYVHFSGRLAYTFLNAGLYLAVIMEIARFDPADAVPAGEEMLLAVVAGVVIADLVIWLSGAERELSLHPEGLPLWPPDAGRMRRSLMLVVAVIVAQIVCRVCDFPASTALVSVMVLTITPDLHSLLAKGALRLEGALLAILFAGIAFVVLRATPSFPLLMALVFLGSFLAVSLSETGPAFGYAGVQMGLVLPMVLIGPYEEIGSLASGLARVGGVVIAVATSVMVALVWAALSPTPPLPLASRPDETKPAAVGDGQR